MNLCILQPEPNDNLGGNVCKLCAEKIYTFYEFRLSYLESEKKLREMLLNFEANQRLMASYSDSMSSMSQDDDNSNVQPKFEKSQTDGIFDSLECPDCGRRFERELELRIHSHIHRHIETPSQNNDSQNGFDDQYLIANIKSEPVEYIFDPSMMDWPDTTQSDGDNVSLQAEDDLRWKCTICEKRFLRRAHLRAHRRQHAIERSDNKSTSFKLNANTSIMSATVAADVSAVAATSITEKKIKLKDDKKTIPAQQKHDKSNVSFVKKKINLNVTADEQLERWQCKKCLSKFRTRRLLRDHNVVHRNSHQSFTLHDLDTNYLTGTSGVDASIIHFDADSDDAVAAATAAAAAMDAERLRNSPTKKMTTTDSPPKSHSTPIGKHSSGEGGGASTNTESRWKCPKCRKAFDTAKALRKHKLANHTFEIKLNLKSKNFISDKKSVSFSDLLTKKKKLESRSQFTERDWPCNSCGQVFNRRNLLREHRRTAHMLKPTAGVSISLKQEEISVEEFAVTN